MAPSFLNPPLWELSHRSGQFLRWKISEKNTPPGNSLNFQLILPETNISLETKGQSLGFPNLEFQFPPFWTIERTLGSRGLPYPEPLFKTGTLKSPIDWNKPGVYDSEVRDFFIASWWFFTNPSVKNILKSKWRKFPQGSGVFQKKCLSCHHLAWLFHPPPPPQKIITKMNMFHI